MFQFFFCWQLAVSLIMWQSSSSGCCNLFLAAYRSIQKFCTGTEIPQEWLDYRKPNQLSGLTMTKKWSVQVKWKQLVKHWKQLPLLPLLQNFILDCCMYCHLCFVSSLKASCIFSPLLLYPKESQVNLLFSTKLILFLYFYQ